MKRIAVLVMVFAILAGLAACTPGGQGETTVPPETEPQYNVYIPPEGKEIRSILFIGNSNSSYFCDELYEMAKEAGIELVVANLYISGCSVQKHAEQIEYGATYTKYTVRENGKVTVTDNTTSVQAALAEREWDAISLQQHYDPLNAANIGIAEASTNKYAKMIYDVLKEEEPSALLFWHQNWAFQLGYPGESSSYVPEEKKITTAEKQQAIHDVMRTNAMQICHENQVFRVPTGDAWQAARADERIGHVLSNKDVNGNTDYIHDGEVGGGQYLNACVWFEVLLQKSCVGNTFDPDYTLSAEKMGILQQIAHQTVVEAYGDGYAK